MVESKSPVIASDHITIPELSADDISSVLGNKISEGGKDRWVQDVFSDWFVYKDSKTQKLYRQGYSVGGNDVELVGKPREVIKVTEYRPVIKLPKRTSRPDANSPWALGNR